MLTVGRAVTTSPAPVRMSISSTDSCGSPARNDEDSIPRPVTAPPSVIVLSCGTTIGVSPCGRVAATRSSYVHMPWTSAVRAGRIDRDHAGQPGDVQPRASRPPVRGRNRLELRLARRTGSPAGMRWYDARSRPTA